MKSNNRKNNKMTVAEILARFFFGFLIPYITINGLILFLFIQVPKITLVEKDSKEYEENKIKFTVSCLLPISYIKVFFQENEVPYTKFGNYYIVDASQNGDYDIQVCSINKAKTKQPITIETQDTIPPSIDTDNIVVQGDILSFKIIDNQSSINFDNIFASLDDGTIITPTYIDRASGTIQFPYDPSKKITIHIEDILGNYSETTFG